MLFLFPLMGNSQAVQGDPEDLFSRKLSLPEVSAPTEWSFYKYLENPVSLYRGQPDVSVDLYTLKDGEIEIPLRLRYNTSGIKVEEEAGWVGLGWNLDVGGYVKRIAVGGDDARDVTFNTYKTLFLQGVNTFQGEHDQIPFTQTMYNGMTYLHPQDNPSKWGKLAPDLYVYTMPGQMGRYVINYSDGSVVQLEREADYSIDNDYYGTGDKVITTPEGIRYCYSRSCVSRVLNETDLLSETYALYSTEYPNGGQVQYRHRSASYLKRSKSAYRTGSLAGGDDPYGHFFLPTSEVHLNDQWIEMTDVTVRQIITPNYIIVFSTSGRSDIDGPQKLDDIIIRARSDSSALKRFAFDYDYFYPASGIPTSDSLDVLRLKLLSVSEVSVANVADTLNRFSFDYNPVPLPPKNSYSFDHWGYANSSDNSVRGNNLADISYIHYPYLSIADSTRIVGSLAHQTKDARHDASYCQAGMLTAIHYPTGGKTCFTYESNRFGGDVIASKGDVEPDVPTVEDEIWSYNNATDHNNTTFQLSGPRQVHLEFTLSKGLNEWSDMTGSKVMKVTGSGTVTEALGYTEMQQIGDDSSPGILKGTKTLELPAGSHKFIAVLPSSLGDQNGANLGHACLRVRIWYKEMDAALQIQTESESFGCGMRIKAISHYDTGSTVPEKVQRYSYTLPDTTATSGVLFDYPVYHELYRYAPYCYHQLHNPLGVFFIGADQFQVLDAPVSNNPYQFGSGVGYTHVEETIDGIPGKKQYLFYNTSAEIHNSLNYRTTSALNGKLREMRLVDSDGKILNSTKYSYRDSISTYYHGVHLVNQLNHFPELINPFDDFWDHVDFSVNHIGYNEHDFSVLRYALNQHDVTLSTVEEYRDGVTKTTHYTYDSHLLNASKSFQNSDGSTIRIRYTHPSDYAFGNYQILASEHILSPVVETRILKDNILIDSHLRDLDAKGKPDRELFGEIGSSVSAATPAFLNGQPNASLYPVSAISYDLRDSRGNPLVCTLGETDTVVYLWSYGYRYPVAEITGATASEVTQSLGGSLSWFSGLVNPEVQLNSLQTALPGALVKVYRYNTLGDVTQMTETNGYSKSYGYDAFGRLTGISQGRGNVQEPVETFSYGTDTLSHVTYLQNDGTRFMKDIVYYNGLGLKEQTVMVGYTPDGYTSAVPHVYDKALREHRKYLPFDFNDTRDVKTAGLQTALETRYRYRDGEAYPYAHVEYESAPSDRIVKEYNTGAVFVTADKPTQTSYRCNTSGEVLRLKVTDTDLLVASGYYADSTLYVVHMTDPDGREHATFTDKSGNVVLERRYLGQSDYCDTYYVYDDRLLLRAILPPNYSASLTGSSSTQICSEMVKNNCYTYSYDNRRRLTGKTLPGVGEELFEYDNRDRIASSQTIYDREHGYSLVSNYDTHGRLISRWKKIAGYTTTPDYQVVYDQYPSWLSADLLFMPVSGVVSTTDRVTTIKGLPVFEFVSDLATSGQTSPSYERRVHYYDAKGREIQKVVKSVTGEICRTSWKYDHVGNVLIKEESVPGVTLRQTYIYDHRNRLVSDVTRVNGVLKSSSSYTYDVFGRQTGVTYPNGVEETFSFNNQNWLTGHTITTSGGTSHNEILRYYESIPGTTPQYSGNIASWDRNGRRYVYVYDVLGRLTDCMSNPLNPDPYINTERGITYDRNGNMLTLKRYVGGILTDDLSFSYTGNHRTSCTYDSMGNITTGVSPDMESLYNRLNLPSVVTDTLSGVVASYSYLVDGTKTRVRLSDDSGMRYIGSARYREVGDTIHFVDMAFDHGRIEKWGTQYRPFIYSTNHLGSVIFETDDLGTITAIHDYLPFGTEMPWLPIQTSLASGKTSYGYNGKEAQPLLRVLDYGARFYHPESATWLSVDPLAEKYSNLSPYSFCASNPVIVLDLNGKTLYIRGYEYNAGKLYKDGNEVSVKQVPRFVRKAYDALQQIEHSQTGAEMVKVLSESSFAFTIKKSSISSFMPDQTKGAYALAKKEAHPDLFSDITIGSGGIINWNPQGSLLLTTEGLQCNPTTDLAHELFHAEDSHFGKLDNRKEQGVKRDEWQAVYKENLLRKELGLPLRTYYIKVIGKEIQGGGPIMIKDGEGICPSWYK